MVADPDDVSDPLDEQFRAFAALNDNDLKALADGFPDERFTNAVLEFLERGGS